MSKPRDLEFFMTNPDQMPGNLDELAAALTGSETASESVAEEDKAPTTGEPSAASGAGAGEAAAKTGVEGENAQMTEAQEQQVVKSKNGKHEIPYSVLETERVARRNAEQAVEEMRQRLEALEQQAKTGQPAPTAQAQPAKAAGFDDEQINQIAEDFPGVAAALKGMAARVAELTGHLEHVQQAEQARRHGEAQRASSTVQEAIDAVPQLTYWQQRDPHMFDAAVKFDNQIKADPRNAGLSLDERFERVVKAVEAVYGQTQLPDEFRKAPAAAASTPATAPSSRSQVDPKQVAAAAQKAIETAQATSAVRSLSDIPGGVPPESDEIAQLGMMSAADLGNKFISMDPKQLLAILAKAA